MSEKDKDIIKKQQEIADSKKIERLNNSDIQKKSEGGKLVYKGSIEGRKVNRDFEGRVSTGDDD